MTSEHWDRTYRGAKSEDLGWYETVPSTLGLVTEYSSPDASVIDIGGGDSRLIDVLLELGYVDLTVLDVSPVALERSRGRLGDRARQVTWITADVGGFTPERTWDIWHDRAVFHFLVDRSAQQAYKTAALRALAPGGRLVVAAFALDAPQQCAGLPVARYSVDSLAARFTPELRPIRSDRIVATQGVGDQRPYVAVVLSHA